MGRPLCFLGPPTGLGGTNNDDGDPNGFIVATSATWQAEGNQAFADFANSCNMRVQYNIMKWGTRSGLRSDGSDHVYP